MNKNILILLALLSFCFACNNSDDVLLSDQIVGEWNIQSFVINSCPDASDNVPITIADENGCVEVFDTQLCLTVSFNRDGTGSFNEDSSQSTGFILQSFDYTVDEEANTVNTVTEDGEVSIFSLSNNQIIFEMDEDGCICAFSFDS